MWCYTKITMRCRDFLWLSKEIFGSSSIKAKNNVYIKSLVIYATMKTPLYKMTHVCEVLSTDTVSTMVFSG